MKTKHWCYRSCPWMQNQLKHLSKVMHICVPKQVNTDEKKKERNIVVL